MLVHVNDMIMTGTACVCTNTTVIEAGAVSVQKHDYDDGHHALTVHKHDNDGGQNSVPAQTYDMLRTSTFSLTTLMTRALCLCRHSIAFVQTK